MMFKSLQMRRLLKPALTYTQPDTMHIRYTSSRFIFDDVIVLSRIGTQLFDEAMNGNYGRVAQKRSPFQNQSFTLFCDFLYFDVLTFRHIYLSTPFSSLFTFIPSHNVFYPCGTVDKCSGHFEHLPNYANVSL